MNNSDIQWLTVVATMEIILTSMLPMVTKNVVSSQGSYLPTSATNVMSLMESLLLLSNKLFTCDDFLEAG